MSEVDRTIAARVGPRLATEYCAVPSYFLAHYHEIVPHPGSKGLGSTEAILIVHLLDYKWDKRQPYPTVGTLAARMNMSRRQVRATLKKLEDQQLLQRNLSSTGGRTRYDLTPLFNRLHSMMDDDLAQAEDEAAA